MMEEGYSEERHCFFFFLQEVFLFLSDEKKSWNICYTSRDTLKYV
jgi:hypothetical protein